MQKYIFIALVIIFSGCNHQQDKKEIKNEVSAIVKTDIKKLISEEQLAIKKDPVCAMPVYKFLEDTTLYKGKIYGFCGKGCKNEFLKKPSDFIPD
jgi:YHS domain-containing protein